MPHVGDRTVYRGLKVVASTRNVRRWLVWMSNVDVTLNDEASNTENWNKSFHCKGSRKGLIVWCGDYNQTAGRLRKSCEVRAFRCKLMRRSETGLQVLKLRQLLHESTWQLLDHR